MDSTFEGKFFKTNDRKINSLIKATKKDFLTHGITPIEYKNGSRHPVKHDITLIKYELCEMEYMDKGMTQEQ